MYANYSHHPTQGLSIEIKLLPFACLPSSFVSYLSASALFIEINYAVGWSKASRSQQWKKRTFFLEESEKWSERKEMFNMERAKVGMIKLIFSPHRLCLVSGVDITSVNNELDILCLLCWMMEGKYFLTKRDTRRRLISLQHSRTVACVGSRAEKMLN